MDVSVLQLINTLINWIICLIVLHFIRFIKAVIHINQIQGRGWNFVPLSKKNKPNTPYNQIITVLIRILMLHFISVLEVLFLKLPFQFSPASIG
jgi:hypothetical protein